MFLLLISLLSFIFSFSNLFVCSICCTCFYHSGHSLRPVSIGRVNVDDADDWDAGDKVYSWGGGGQEDVSRKQQQQHQQQHQHQHHYQQHPAGVSLEESNGAVQLTKPEVGVHELRFHVLDRRHQQEARSSMRVEVRSVPVQVILSAGSLRIVGTSAAALITAWDRRTRRRVASLKERLEAGLKKVVDAEQLEIFAINERPEPEEGRQPRQNTVVVVDVHYWARSKNRILSSVYLNSIVQAKRLELSELLGSVSITLSGLDPFQANPSRVCVSLPI